ncbi:hypothetical protein E2C01_068821 [Portunus trituberculatus]|uniref:Uncharacterized protein n=1 Tax=Portunus trituberculatus TaxID=210409 RepID=A0A5B7HNE7_PORTR|nr:hypothetical protein [Portunus trituberculatus]
MNKLKLQEEDTVPSPDSPYPGGGGGVGELVCGWMGEVGGGDGGGVAVLGECGTARGKSQRLLYPSPPLLSLHALPRPPIPQSPSPCEAARVLLVQGKPRLHLSAARLAWSRASDTRQPSFAPAALTSTCPERGGQRSPLLCCRPGHAWSGLTLIVGSIRLTQELIYCHILSVYVVKYWNIGSL